MKDFNDDKINAKEGDELFSDLLDQNHDINPNLNNQNNQRHNRINSITNKSNNKDKFENDKIKLQEEINKSKKQKK